MLILLISQLASARDFTPEMLDAKTTQIELNVQRDGPGLTSNPLLVHYGISDRLELQLESNGYQVGQGGGYQGTALNLITKAFDGHNARPAMALLVSGMPPLGIGAGGYFTALIDWEFNDSWMISTHPGISSYQGQGTIIYSYTGAALGLENFGFYLWGGIEAQRSPSIQNLTPIITETTYSVNDTIELGFYTQGYPFQPENPWIMTLGMVYYGGLHIDELQ